MLKHNTKVMILILSMCLAISMCGCSSKNDESSDYENTVIISKDDKLLNESMAAFLSGKLPDGDVYFEPSVTALANERIYNYDPIDTYASTNAFYYKVLDKDTGTYYMYRFQMGSSGKIESYVRYTLEV